MVKIAVFGLLKLPNLFSRKIWVTGNHEVSTLCSSKWYLSLFLPIFKTFFFVKVHARKDKKTEGNPLILLMMVGKNRKLIWVTCDREINPLQSQVPFSHAKTTQIRFYFWDLWNLGGLFRPNTIAYLEARQILQQKWIDVRKLVLKRGPSAVPICAP